MENQMVRRIAKLVESNKELSQELRVLRDRYNELLYKNEAYEQIVQKYVGLTEIKKKWIGEKPESRKVGMATVLYANIHGFRDIIPGAPVKENTRTFIDQLDDLFIRFDEIISNYSVVKIKTIGDSYMCVGGIPEKNITNPIEVVLAAFKMTQVDAFPGESLSVRVAVHTGPLTACANGKIKTTYDIKGDTVNIASRMEASGLNRNVLISIMTYELVKEFFECEYYGRLPVKYKGDLDIYTVKGIKPELSLDGLGKEPNTHFDTKLALIQFHDLQEMVLDLLEEKLPKDLFYHNLKHTVDVVTEVELIGWAEGVSEEELILLKTAA
jgi:adenylate cyclase